MRKSLRKVNENLDSAKDSSSLQVTVVVVSAGGEARLDAREDLAGTKKVRGASRILAERDPNRMLAVYRATACNRFFEFCTLPIRSA